MNPDQHTDAAASLPHHGHSLPETSARPFGWDRCVTQEITGPDMWWQVAKDLIHPDLPDDPATHRSRYALAQLFLNAGGDDKNGRLTPRTRSFIDDLAISFALEHASPEALDRLPLVRLTRDPDNTHLTISFNYELMLRANRHDLYETIQQWLATLGLRPHWIGRGAPIRINTITGRITTRETTPAPGSDPNAEYPGLNFVWDEETNSYATHEVTIAYSGPMPDLPTELASFTVETPAPTPLDLLLGYARENTQLPTDHLEQLCTDLSTWVPGTEPSGDDFTHTYQDMLNNAHATAATILNPDLARETVKVLTLAARAQVHELAMFRWVAGRVAWHVQVEEWFGTPVTGPQVTA